MNLPTIFFCVAWRLGSLFQAATNQAPHALKLAPSSSLYIAHIELYALVMNMRHTLVPYHRYIDGIDRDGLCPHVPF